MNCNIFHLWTMSEKKIISTLISVYGFNRHLNNKWNVKNFKENIHTLVKMSQNEERQCFLIRWGRFTCSKLYILGVWSNTKQRNLMSTHGSHSCTSHFLNSCKSFSKQSSACEHQANTGQVYFLFQSVIVWLFVSWTLHPCSQNCFSEQTACNAPLLLAVT